MTVAATAAPILVYDGDCAFCSRTVQLVLRHDRTHRSLRFAAREGRAGRAVRERHLELVSVDSVLWVEWVDGRERVRVRSDAALAIGEYLGGRWRVLAGLGRLVPRTFREPVYRFVARHRRRLSGDARRCVVFGPSERARALD